MRRLLGRLGPEQAEQGIAAVAVPLLDRQVSQQGQLFGNYHSGLLWIKGTYYWIKDQGKGWVWTLGYYYDLSANAYYEYIAVTLL